MTPHLETIFSSPSVESFYDIAFAPKDNIFAVVGGQTVLLLKHLETSICIIGAFLDSENKTEEFYCCAWTWVNNLHVLCVAGKDGVLKVLDVNSMTLLKALIGHGFAILDLSVHPLDPNIIASASEDNSIRLWNIHSGETICIFAGEGGHKEQVICCEFHPMGKYLASGGMDNTLKIWKIPENFVQLQISYPIFSSRELHTDYIDSIQFYGDLIVSKAASQCRIIIWQIVGFPSSNGQDNCTIKSSSIERIATLDLPGSQNWYIRHSISTDGHLICGNGFGCIFSWILKDLQVENPVESIKADWSGQVPEYLGIIRKAKSFRNGEYLLACGEGGKILVWRICV